MSRAEHPLFILKFAIRSLLNFSHRSKTTLIVHFWLSRLARYSIAHCSTIGCSLICQQKCRTRLEAPPSKEATREKAWIMVTSPDMIRRAWWMLTARRACKVIFQQLDFIVAHRWSAYARVKSMTHLLPLSSYHHCKNHAWPPSSMWTELETDQVHQSCLWPMWLQQKQQQGKKNISHNCPFDPSDDTDYWGY
jgi:hypothetical protein